jgi:DNA-binding NtrC family response regulator
MTVLYPRRRNCAELLQADQDVLGFLTDGGDSGQALKSSLDHLAHGLGSAFALLLLVDGGDDGEDRELRALHWSGMTDAHVHQCEQRQSGAPVAPSLIGAAIAAREPRCQPAARPHAEEPTCGEGNTDDHVLCIPVLEPLSDVVAAVICLRTRECPYHESATAHAYSSWLETYSRSVAHAFAYYFDRRRGTPRAAEPARLPRRLNSPELIGESSQTHALRRRLHEIYVPASDARDPEPVLILGEKGTGKDLVARYLHAYSRRRDRPLVVVNCAEITDDLAASRFFGHRKGTFTGAVSDELGLFRAADKSVLFLDEIGELSLRAQATLLRVLENRTVVPVGDTREIPVDVQVILATNRDLERAVDDGLLKADFLDRFRIQSIRVAPLRERVPDIPPLVRHFQARHEQRTATKTAGFTTDAVKALLSYCWPGNVRELGRVCSLVLTHARHAPAVDREFLFRCYPDAGKPGRTSRTLCSDDAPLRTATRAFQRELILQRLERHGWDARATRESLRLPKTTFQRCLSQVGITIAAAAAGREYDTP